MNAAKKKEVAYWIDLGTKGLAFVGTGILVWQVAGFVNWFKNGIDWLIPGD